MLLRADTIAALGVGAGRGAWLPDIAPDFAPGRTDTRSVTHASTTPPSEPTAGSLSSSLSRLGASRLSDPTRPSAIARSSAATGLPVSREVPPTQARIGGELLLGLFGRGATFAPDPTQGPSFRGNDLTAIVRSYALNQRITKAIFATDLVNHDRTKDVRVDLKGGITLWIGQDARLGEYGLFFDKDTREFILVDGDGRVTRAKVGDDGFVDFRNGLRLSLSDDFDPQRNRDLQVFKLITSGQA